MKVQDVMNGAPPTVGVDTPVERVVQLLAESGLPGLPVVDAGGAVLGMIGEEDLIMRNADVHLPTFLNILDGFFPVRGQHEFEVEVRHILASRAGEIMAERFQGVGPDAEVSEAATIMVEKHANPLPVVQHGRLVGLISRADIVRLLARNHGVTTGETPTTA